MVLKYKELIAGIRQIYGPGTIPLHRPIFDSAEIQSLTKCIESNFVSSAGQLITDFENQIADFMGVRHCIATVNGTSALHISLLASGVVPGDEVLTQALTFVATANAIRYCGGKPVFIDVDPDTLGMSPFALRKWLEQNTRNIDGKCVNSHTGNTIRACVPMHTFGFPCRVEEIISVSNEFGIPVIEDCAESLGSYEQEAHTGTTSTVATLSFNGNKIITTGGGGMICTNSEEIAQISRHLSTTAKRSHPYEFYHDTLGYNYRMPNLNAALGLSQLNKLPHILKQKLHVSHIYEELCSELGLKIFKERINTKANRWLNAIQLKNKNERDTLLDHCISENIQARPIWTLMTDLPMYSSCQRDTLKFSTLLAETIVNVPSSVPMEEVN